MMDEINCDNCKHKFAMNGTIYCAQCKGNVKPITDKKFNVDVPVWADIPVIVYAKNKEEALEIAKEIVFVGGKGEYQTKKLLFDHDRFTGGKLYNHTIDNFVKEIKEKTDNGRCE